MAKLQVVEGYIQSECYQTWYRTTGQLPSTGLPLVVLHGGPGFTHDYLDGLDALAESGRAVIQYDQLGNGKSSHLPGQGCDFWTIDVLVAQLEDVLTGVLGRSTPYALLGHSFGAVLAVEHAIRRPTGLKALVLGNAFASMALFIKGAMELRAALPEAVQEVLDRHEREGTTSDPAYQSAFGEFFRLHVCRKEPLPPELQRSLAALAQNPKVFRCLYGPSLFQLEGSLKSWSAVPRLGRIAVPTLVYRGAYDEVTAAAVAPLVSRIPSAATHVFEDSSHLPHIEQRDICLALIRAFVEKYDS